MNACTCVNDILSASLRILCNELLRGNKKCIYIFIKKNIYSKHICICVYLYKNFQVNGHINEFSSHAESKQDICNIKI